MKAARLLAAFLICLVIGLAPLRAEPLRIGVQFGISYIPFFVADREEIFKKHLAQAGAANTEISFPRFSGTPALLDALLASQLEMAVCAPTGLSIIWDKTRGTSSEVIGVSGATYMPFSTVTFKDSIRSLKDVTPADRFVTPSLIGTSAYILRIASEKELGDGNFFTPQVVMMPNPDAITAMLRKQEITILLTSPPYTDWLMRQPGAHRIWSSTEVMGGPASTLVLCGARRYADTHPEIVKAVIAALDEANARIVADPRRAAEIYLTYEPSKTFDANFVTELLSDGEHGFSTSVSHIMTYVDYQVRHGEMKNRPASWKDLFLPYIHDRPGS